MPQIKGFAIRGLLKFVKESGHPGGIAALVTALPPPAAEHFGTRILSSRWYPYEAFTGLLEAIGTQMDDGSGAIFERIGEFSGGQDAGSIFRFIAALSSIQSIVRRAPALWARYCDAGRFELVEVGDGKLLLALEQFPDVDRRHCALIPGWIRGLGRQAGARDPEVHQHRCVHHGDARCEFAGRWS